MGAEEKGVTDRERKAGWPGNESTQKQQGQQQQEGDVQEPRLEAGRGPSVVRPSPSGRLSMGHGEPGKSEHQGGAVSHAQTAPRCPRAHSSELGCREKPTQKAVGRLSGEGSNPGNGHGEGKADPGETLMYSDR